MDNDEFKYCAVPLFKYLRQLDREKSPMYESYILAVYSMEGVSKFALEGKLYKFALDAGLIKGL